MINTVIYKGILMKSNITYGFWKKLKKPFFILAPMANITDAVFRRIIAKYGKPDVMVTEFASCDGLCSPGKKTLLTDLMYSEKERPIVAQLTGSRPDTFFSCAQLAAKLNFDGIDINMGCPDKTVCKNGEGAALMKKPALAREIIRAVKKGAPHLPVSVKTRIGYNTISIDKWILTLLKEKPALITIHGRTKKQMRKKPVHWNMIERAAQLSRGSGTLIVGNGDILSVEEGIEKAKKYKLDGVMLGRAIYGNPWLFKKIKKNSRSTSVKKRLEVMVEHAYLFKKIFGEKKNFLGMRKHFNAYASGFDGAKELRIKLNQASDPNQIKDICITFFDNRGFNTSRLSSFSKKKN